MAACPRVLLRLLNVLDEGVVFDAEAKGWAARRVRKTHVGVAAGRFGEEEEVRDAERTAHGGVIAEFICSSFL